MMLYILVVTLFFAWFAAIIYLSTRAMDGEVLLGVAAGAIAIVGLAFVLYSMAQEENSGPCLKEETQWAYNAGTKTTMPYTVCVQRGEWVNP